MEAMNTLLEQDKLWAEIHTSEEWARTEPEKFIPLNAPRPQDVADEISRLRNLRQNRFRTPHEL